MTILFVLSDGKSTVGRDPLSAAADAAKARVKIFTVAVGTQQGVAHVPDDNGVVHDIPVPPHPESLQAVASRTGGRFLGDLSVESLRTAYREVVSRLRPAKQRQDLTFWFAGAALGLAALSLALWVTGRTRPGKQSADGDPLADDPG